MRTGRYTDAFDNGVRPANHGDAAGTMLVVNRLY